MVCLQEQTTSNYRILLLSSLIYFILLIIVIGAYFFKFITIAPFLTIFFYRFLEYQLTGIHIEFLFAYTTGIHGKHTSYLSLLIALGGLLFFAYLGIIR